MGKVSDTIDEAVREFIEAQHVFFVATAPNDPGAHLNLSPKGLDTFRVLGPRSVAYLDYPGSGVETIAHLRENGRIVVMFCAFTGSPKILRLHGRGHVAEPRDPEFASLIGRFRAPASLVRSVIVVDVERVSDSCGYAVPLYSYTGERDTLLRWAEKKGESGLVEYQRQKNAHSIDGLPGLRWVELGKRSAE
jgi:hypothetical protein